MNLVLAFVHHAQIANLTMNWAASAAVGYGFSMLVTMHWQANSSRGCLYNFLVSSSGGTIVAMLKTAFSGVRQLGKTSAKKYHHIPMLGVESGPCNNNPDLKVT